MRVVESPNYTANKKKSSSSSQEQYKVGGTAIFVKQGLHCRVDKIWQDTRGWGRYSGVLLLGGEGRGTVVLNVLSMQYTTTPD